MKPEVKTRIEDLLGKAEAICATAEQDNNRMLTPEEMQQIEGFMVEARNIKAQDDQRSGIAEIRATILDLDAQHRPQMATDPSGGRPTARRGTPGQQFAEDAEFLDFRNKLLTGGTITKAQFGHSPRVVLNDLVRLGGSNGAAELTTPDQTGILVPYQRRPLTIMDVITVSPQINTDVVEYVEVTSETNNADVVAESPATATQSPANATTGYKPESAATFTRKSATVRTIATWIPATRQALADAAQIRTYIDDFLRDDLAQVLEDEVITGDGSGENFSGIDDAAGLSQAFDTDVFTTTRKARTKLMTQGRDRANAWLLNPLDMETIDLTTDANDDFYGQGPFGMSEQTMLWRTPVIEHEGVPEGTAYLGNFKRCILWPRSAAEVMVSDSHADFFVRNLLAILAELRAAFAVVRPKSIVKVTLS